MRGWLIALSVALVLLLAGGLGVMTGEQHSQAAIRGQVTQLQAQLQAQLRATRARLAQVAVTDRQANISHLGLCFQQTYDQDTFDVSSVLLETPQTTDGVPSCPAGSFVSIVPAR